MDGWEKLFPAAIEAFGPAGAVVIAAQAVVIVALWRRNNKLTDDGIAREIEQTRVATLVLEYMRSGGLK